MAIIRCSCTDTWMDKTYGKGNRVGNQTIKKPPTFRCVKCGKEVPVDRVVRY